MCYLVRQHQPEAQGGGASLPRGEGLRPRWIAAGALTLLGSLAVAAALVAPPKAPFANAQDRAAPARPATTAAAVPIAAAVEQRSLPTDDGVPTASKLVQSGAGYCDHGL